MNLSIYLSPKEPCQMSQKRWYLSSTISDLIIPIGSICLHLYGLPKIRKAAVTLRIIHSFKCSSQNKVAKWFTIVLQPLLYYYSVHSITDSLQVSIFINGYLLIDMVVCFFDVFRLFTYIPFLETIYKWTYVLYRCYLSSVRSLRTFSLN